MAFWGLFYKNINPPKPKLLKTSPPNTSTLRISLGLNFGGQNIQSIAPDYPVQCWIEILGTDVLAFFLGESIQSFIKYVVSCKFSWVAFIRLRKFLYMSSFLRGFKNLFLFCFYHEWILSSSFPTSIKRIICVLCFILLVRYHIIAIWILNQPCVPSFNPTWSWCVILFIGSWIWLVNILLRTFVCKFMRDIGICFLFFFKSLSGFGIRVPWYKVFPSPLSSGGVWEGLVLFFLL